MVSRLLALPTAGAHEYPLTALVLQVYHAHDVTRELSGSEGRRIFHMDSFCGFSLRTISDPTRSSTAVSMMLTSIAPIQDAYSGRSAHALT